MREREREKENTITEIEWVYQDISISLHTNRFHDKLQIPNIKIQSEEIYISISITISISKRWKKIFSDLIFEDIPQPRGLFVANRIEFTIYFPPLGEIISIGRRGGIVHKGIMLNNSGKYINSTTRRKGSKYRYKLNHLHLQKELVYRGKAIH